LLALTFAGIGCPHEKHTEAVPGVAMVVIPHEGQATSVTMETASVAPFLA
jgi:hypothetical protein